ncbi:hypothetical protein QYF36_019415 [Acer negundo]|nr:hypothetical protein QYF36_019415 [Acer negundo]
MDGGDPSFKKKIQIAHLSPSSDSKANVATSLPGTEVGAVGVAACPNWKAMVFSDEEIKTGEEGHDYLQPQAGGIGGGGGFLDQSYMLFNNGELQLPQAPISGESIINTEIWVALQLQFCSNF